MQVYICAIEGVEIGDFLHILNAEFVKFRYELLLQLTRRLSKSERLKLIEEMTREMKNAAKLLEFEHAAYLRDRIQELQNMK